MSLAEESQIEEDVARFLGSEKLITGACVWKTKQHADYREVVKVVECPEFPELNGELRMTAHVTRVPQKASFSLLLGSVRTLSLDVNPASSHYNFATLTSVNSTHWQQYPSYEAVVDNRELSHGDWLANFCLRAKIKLTMAYKPPPHEPPQLILI